MNNEFLPIWENPEIQEINRLAARSHLLPFTNVQDALANAVAGPEYRKDLSGFTENPFYFNLDGEWKFQLRLNPNGEIADLKTDNWRKIQVPGTWSRQGGNEKFENCFDKPHYTNVQMPFQALPPKAPAENPTGYYQRSFTLPSLWKKRRVVLHIGSAESVAIIYVNGVFAGAGKDTRLPQEYDITGFLTEGENILLIKVVRYSDASYVEDQDQWWLGGIHRSVYLYSTDDCYVKDIKAVPGEICEEDRRKEGRLNLCVTAGGNLTHSRSTGNVETASKENDGLFKIKYDLYPFTMPVSAKDAQDIAGNLIKNGSLVSGSMEFHPDYRLNSNCAAAQLVLENPKQWSHETPELYILCVELHRNGKLLECFAFCTGFRNLKIAKREFLINAKAVYIKGANRHEHDEKTGKTLSTESMVRDIKILKSHNFNAVRTSHYPDDERWYELCDRYGIYLWNEANIESHCFWNQLCEDTDWSYAFLIRMQRMVLRDKNHACVVVWSLGNESGCGSNHEAGAAWIRGYDKSRPVHYEGAMRGKGEIPQRWQHGKTLSDIVCPMYPVIENIINFSKYIDDERPLIMCEYSHAMGNSNGSLSDYWKAVKTHRGLQGGFIWEWIDQGFEAFTSDGRKYWKYGGDFGDNPSDLDFICDGLLFPDQSLKPAMAECKQVFAPVSLKEIPGKLLTFTLENNYDFSTLDHLGVSYKIFADSPAENSCAQGTAEILKEGVIDLPPLEPGQSIEISFNSDESFSPPLINADIIFHADFILKTDTAWAEKGHVVYQAQKILKESILTLETILKNRSLSSDHGAGKTEAASSALRLESLFKPCLYRVPVQNDGLKTTMKLRGDPAMSFYFKDKAMYHWIDLDLLHLRTSGEKKEEISYNGLTAVRSSAALLAGENASSKYKNYSSAAGLGSYTYYFLNGNPSILEVVFDLDSGLPELPRVGIMAQIPSSYKEISWFGKGPHESYPDRMEAAFLGHYKHSIKDFEVPYVVPQENGSRSGVKNFTLINNDPSKNITIRTEEPVSICCSRYSQQNMWEALHTCDLIDLSCGDNGSWFLFIDIARRGVGTATCGPDTRKEYRVRPGVFKMRLYIY